MPGMAPSAWRLGAGAGVMKVERREVVEKVCKDREDRDIDLNVPYVMEEESMSATSSTSGEKGGSGASDEVHYRGGAGDASYRGVRHRPELNKWVTEIRPTAQKRKIWLGTYKTPEEAARAYDVGIHYTGKKIPLNFPDSMPNLPELPRGTWEEIAPFVKKQAVSAAKRHRGF
uniref:Dehydration-responsive element-binding protein 5-8 n=1 Tax=Syntrichia caninervis TaxID=200751 RepID=A0A144LHE8_9BRYO|nr:dehydration-responsive element-binding protein 5-8 [Syntrichia caninervis]